MKSGQISKIGQNHSIKTNKEVKPTKIAIPTISIPHTCHWNSLSLDRSIQSHFCNCLLLNDRRGVSSSQPHRSMQIKSTKVPRRLRCIHTEVRVVLLLLLTHRREKRGVCCHDRCISASNGLPKSAEIGTSAREAKHDHLCVVWSID